MSIYGDLSKAQREILQQLFHGPDPNERAVSGPGAETAVPPAGKRAVPDRSQAAMAVSIDTALTFRSKRLQAVRNLVERGLVGCEHRLTYLPSQARAWLTEAGLQLMRSLDYRHAR